MKTHTLQIRVENKDIFEAIKTGKKKIETRAGTDKYIKIQVDDKLKFVCGKETFERSVTKIKLFKTISAILKVYSFPNYREKIKKHGLIAFELK